MTLEEAIKHAEEVAEINEHDGLIKSAAELRQIAEWLKILKSAEFEYDEAWRIITHPTADVNYADKQRAQVILDTFRNSLGAMKEEGIKTGGRMMKDVVGTDKEYIKDIEELPPAQPEPQWIPCSERLPDVAQRVLLSGHGTVMVGMLHSSGKYSLEPTGISYVYQKDDIDAWMPLPEPYKAERRTE